MQTTKSLFEYILREYFRVVGYDPRSRTVTHVLDSLTNHQFQQTGFDAGREALIKLLDTASKHRRREIKALLYSTDQVKFFKGIQIVACAIALVWSEDKIQVLLLVIEHLRQSAITGVPSLNFLELDSQKANDLQDGFRRECQDIIDRARAQEVN